MIAVPNRRKRKKTVHVNMLKHWITPDASVLSILLLHDEEDEEIVSTVKDDEHPLTGQQRHQLNQTLLQWEKTLNPEPGKVSTTVHVINTGSSSPTIVPQYQIAPAWKEPLRDELRSMAKTGIIRPSLSPWASPVLPVKKKDGTIRVCVDFRKLNAATIPDPYEMPRIDGIIDQLGEAKILSKLDLSKGFYQVPINPDDVEKTAFQTPIGKFEFLAMPFGLRNAPATFQRLMDILLGDTPEFACAYMDDVIIFSNSWDDHLKHINIVMSKLAESGLTAKPSKCEWEKARLVYLGHRFGGGLVAPEDCKVEAVKHFQQPGTKTGIRSFLGLAGYYRRFIPGFADHSVHLTDARGKKAPQQTVWTDELDDEFRYLKQALSSASVLTLPRRDDVFRLGTDATDVGIGAVLSV